LEKAVAVVSVDSAAEVSEVAVLEGVGRRLALYAWRFVPMCLFVFPIAYCLLPLAYYLLPLPLLFPPFL
jgi:hypothetical protein